MSNNARDILVSKPDSLGKQFVRYLFAAVAASVVDYTLLFTLTDIFHWYYLGSAATSFIMGLSVSYTLSISWVFTKSKYKNRIYEFFIFFIIGAIGLIINLFIMFYFTDLIKFHYMGSKIVATLFIHFWNFFARKHILFS